MNENTFPMVIIILSSIFRSQYELVAKKFFYRVQPEFTCYFWLMDIFSFFAAMKRININKGIYNMTSNRKVFFLFLAFPLFGFAGTPACGQVLTAQFDEKSESISVFRDAGDLLLTQHVKENIRPYINPIIEPDGNGELTEFSPEHHKHQTGLYWGLKKVNGRDYFMNWKEDYWRKISAKVIRQQGSIVQWQSIYDLLGEGGKAILRETQNWSMQEIDGRFVIDLEWKGDANENISIEKFYVGGLFLRMPWRKDTGGTVVNSKGQKNSDAELQRAYWNDVGVPINGRTDEGHIAIFEHPSNAGFPNAWRVDNELGVGPSRQISGDWSISKGESETIRYRLVVYTGSFNQETVARLWKEYSTK